MGVVLCMTPDILLRTIVIEVKFMGHFIDVADCEELDEFDDMMAAKRLFMVHWSDTKGSNRG